MAWYDTKIIAALIGASVALIAILIKDFWLTPLQEKNKRQIQLIDRVLTEAYIPMQLFLLKKTLYHLLTENRLLIDKNFHLLSSEIQDIFQQAIQQYKPQDFGLDTSTDNDKRMKVVNKLQPKLERKIAEKIEELRSHFIQANKFSKFA